MKAYEIKKLIHGIVLGEEHINKIVVAVPDKFYGKELKVSYQGKEMTIPKVGKDALAFRKFWDKFGRDKSYSLIYYEWKPLSDEEQAELNFKTYLL